MAEHDERRLLEGGGVSIAALRVAYARPRELRRDGGDEEHGRGHYRDIRGCPFCNDANIIPDSTHLAWQCMGEILRRTRPAATPRREVQRRLGWPEHEKMTEHDIKGPGQRADAGRALRARVSAARAVARKEHYKCDERVWVRRGQVPFEARLWATPIQPLF